MFSAGCEKRDIMSLNRALASGAEGCGFESLLAYKVSFVFTIGSVKKYLLVNRTNRNI